ILSFLFPVLLLAGCDREHPEPEVRTSRAQTARMETARAPGRGSMDDTAARSRYAAFRTVFSDVASMTIPSVVSISMEKTVNSAQNPFEFFFDRPFGNPPGRQ